MVKIKDVLDISKGMRLAGDAREEGLYPLFTCKVTIPRSDFSDYEGEHILIGSGGYFRIYRSKGKFSASSDMFVCKAKREVSIVFLYHILRTKMEYFNSKGKGSTIKHLSKRLLEEELIQLPPYAVQLEIEKKLLAVESVVGEIESNFKEFDLVRKEILNRAFRGELTEQDIADGTGQELLTSIQLEREHQEAGTKRKKRTELQPVEAGEEPYDLPENWMWTRLGGVVSVKGGKRLPSGHEFSTTKTGHPYLRVADMKDNSIELNSLLYITKDTHEKIKNYTISANDVYVTIAGTIGRVGLISKHLDGSNLTENACKLVPHSSEYSKEFVLHYLSSDFVQKNFVEVKSQTAQPKLALYKVENTEFPLPPLAEQHRIVEKIKAIFATLNTMEQAIILQKAEASTCYEEILRKSLEGAPEKIPA
jgi:type I restriction enzyme S subunit